jgi:hypothetical protein
MGFQLFIWINLDQCIFELIDHQLETKGLLIKKGTIIDASILIYISRPLSDNMRKELNMNPFAQTDTDATSTKKGGSY